MIAYKVRRAEFDLGVVGGGLAEEVVIAGGGLESVFVPGRAVICGVPKVHHGALHAPVPTVGAGVRAGARVADRDVGVVEVVGTVPPRTLQPPHGGAIHFGNT